LAYDTLVRELKKLLFLNVTSIRKQHILSTAEYANVLCDRYALSYDPVYVACLAHDLFRDWTLRALRNVAFRNGLQDYTYLEKQPILYHGIIAGLYLKRKLPQSREKEAIIEAVSYHTSGYPFNSYVGKILFISDAIECRREFHGVKRLRKLAMRDYEAAFLEVLKEKIIYSVRQGYYLLPQTMDAWNEASRTKNRKG
jgi:predicted HD superfamily hydrolase involved in NAD metabolism